MLQQENKSPSGARDTEALRQTVRDVAREFIKSELKSGLFSERKLTDTPTDALQVVNRKYVTMSGATSARPTASVTGQRYFDTTSGRPVYWSGSTWVDAAGSVS